MCLSHTHIFLCLHFQVCIYSAHKILFVPSQCVCVCVPLSLPVLSQEPIWLLWGPLLHGVSAWFMVTGQLQLLSHFHRFTSHTSPKKHSSYRSAPTILPPADKLCRDTETIFLWVGRILEKHAGRHFHLSPSICLTKSPAVLQLGWAMFVFSSAFAFSQRKPIWSEMLQTICTTPFKKHVYANYNQLSFSVLFFPFSPFLSPSLLLIILSFQLSHTPPWSNLKCKVAGLCSDTRPNLTALVGASVAQSGAMRYSERHIYALIRAPLSIIQKLYRATEKTNANKWHELWMGIDSWIGFISSADSVASCSL